MTTVFSKSMIGWYGKVKCDKGEAKTRWITINRFFIRCYENVTDNLPHTLLHVDKLQMQDAYKDIEQIHSVKLVLGHICTIKNVYIYTPNQFDIIEIRKAIENEQQGWINCTKTQPILPRTFGIDITGKFLFRISDRLQFIIKDVKTLFIDSSTNPMSINLDKNFDIHSALDNSENCRWFLLKYQENGSECLKKYHCTVYEELEILICCAYHCLYASGEVVA